MSRKQIDELVRGVGGRGAHLDFETATADMPVEMQGRIPPGHVHSPWQVLEHLRIAQRDIVDFSRSADHATYDWPEDYWPDDPQPLNERAWSESIDQFLDDRAAFVALLRDPNRDPAAAFDWGDGQSLMREAITLAQHNSYHLGELIALRRALGAWE